MAEGFSNYTSSFKYRRLNAERDVVPEIESESEELHTNGDGASNLIRKFINYSERDEKLIEVKLLEQLNKIMFPEACFERILVQQIQKEDEMLWEIFLEEKNSGRFALSQSGSGLKTIILILLNLLIVPETVAYKNKKIVYAFEEIENNLHPALQRKIFSYLYDYSVNNDVCIFVTTHSHVAINTYFNKERATIYHVVKSNNESTIKAVENHLDKIQILDDLEVKASDILQSNGIIWVEGPTDRIYIKKWLAVFCDNTFIEGEHYQFLYYGGKLLYYYTMDQIDNLINILLTNRNAIIVIDSDKRNKYSKNNSTKKRISKEFDKNKCFCWITKGKEIENYLSYRDISDCFGYKLNTNCGQYEPFNEYIEDKYKSYATKKVEFAQTLEKHITKANSIDILDLSTQITSVYESIKKWNCG
jgi:hypothetical protein